MRTSFAPFIFCLLSACAIGHPCKESGDVTFPGFTVKGDMRCKQKEFNGKWKNDGRFEQFHMNGILALEGNFKEGMKEGIWLYYAEDGHLKAVKYYENDVDRNPPPGIQKEIDLILLKNTKANVKNDEKAHK